MRTQREIKLELSELLAQDNPDMSQILALSSELAKTDDKNVRFTVDAGLVSRLGKELVGKAETAVSELVKNAYDADSIHADVIFKNADKVGGTLVIDDDGSGMDKTGLIEGFMRLSSADKIHHPYSPIYKRKRAGQKGIGRFATQRLGERLTIITQTESAQSAIKTVIDWGSFKTDTDLITIANKIEPINKSKPHGTTLIIEGLLDAWSDPAIVRVYKNLANLIQPESLTKNDLHLDQYGADKAFTISVYRNERSPENLVIDEDSSFLSYALATIEGYVDDKGYGFWKYNCPKLDIKDSGYKRIGKERDNEDRPYDFLKNVKFKTSYFIYEKGLLPANLYGYIKNLGNELGGIKIYRNGFRVPPYGNKGNDWAGFDESVRRRTYLFPHQNQCYFGFVELAPDVAEMFEETSSREGIIESDTFDELKNFVYRAVISACSDIASLRGRKVTANQKDWETKTKHKVDEALTTIHEFINNNQQQFDDSSTSDKEKVNQAIEDLQEGIIEQQEQKQKLIDEINMLRVFAGLGLVIGEFVHEIKHLMGAIEHDLHGLQTYVQGASEYKEHVARLATNMGTFRDYLIFFEGAVSRNVDRSLESINLKFTIKEFIRTISNDLSRSNIEVTNNFGQSPVLFQDIKTIPMHPSEWVSILFNLYSNSKKAIIKARPSEGGKIDISCSLVEDKIYLDFSDNGTGIDNDIKDRIFDAFFTTTSAPAQNASDQETYTSTGLGLKIISDMIESYGGTIEVIAPKEGYKTTFRITITKQ